MPVAVERIAHWAAGLEARAIKLVPVSAHIFARALSRRAVGGEIGGLTQPCQMRLPYSSPPNRSETPVPQDLPYRRSAGVALINAKADVFVGRRKKERDASLVVGHEWQMPQGGLDDGESPLQAAKRELFEETNISSISFIAEAPDWLSYDLPANANGRFRGRYRGQTQKWFLFRFEGKESEINIDRPAGGHHAAEFQAWRWERWEALPELVVPFKRAVYERVVAVFAPIARAPRT